jgi:hypothetical protein
VVCLNRRTAAHVEQAVRIVSEASIFWAGVSTNRAKIRKVELSFAPKPDKLQPRSEQQRELDPGFRTKG